MIKHIIGFILFVLVEFIVVYFICKKDVKQVLLYVVLINIFTWPLANFFYGLFLAFLVIEVLVIAVEGLLLKKLLEVTYTRAMIASLVANFITMMIGIMFLSYG